MLVKEGVGALDAVVCPLDANRFMFSLGLGLRKAIWFGMGVGNGVLVLYEVENRRCLVVGYGCGGLC
jgi:hypothetical protein